MEKISRSLVVTVESNILIKLVWKNNFKGPKTILLMYKNEAKEVFYETLTCWYWRRWWFWRSCWIWWRFFNIGQFRTPLFRTQCYEVSGKPYWLDFRAFWRNIFSPIHRFFSWPKLNKTYLLCTILVISSRFEIHWASCILSAVFLLVTASTLSNSRGQFPMKELVAHGLSFVVCKWRRWWDLGGLVCCQ